MKFNPKEVGKEEILKRVCEIDLEIKAHKTDIVFLEEEQKFLQKVCGLRFQNTGPGHTASGTCSTCGSYISAADGRD